MQHRAFNVVISRRYTATRNRAPSQIKQIYSPFFAPVASVSRSGSTRRCGRRSHWPTGSTGAKRLRLCAHKPHMQDNFEESMRTRSIEPLRSLACTSQLIQLAQSTSWSQSRDSRSMYARWLHPSCAPIPQANPQWMHHSLQPLVTW